MNIHHKKKIYEVIQSAILHIKEAQQPCGNFLSLSSSSPTDFSHAISYSTTFFASNILSCLCTIDLLALNDPFFFKTRDILKSVTHRNAEFLFGEKNEDWSFNYFSRNERERVLATPSYPDDLDDTFAALIALQKYQPQLISGDVLAAITKLLINTETKEGGPYRTWIMPLNAKGPQNDPDIVVNSTIGHSLSLFGVPSPHIGKYLKSAIQQQKLSSSYYSSAYQITYFLSRYLKKEILPTFTFPLANAITPLESAMLMSSYFHCDDPQKTTPIMVDHLVNTIHRNGWRPYPFCIDPAQNHKFFYAGSSALTAAFVAEALMRYLHTPPNQNNITAQHVDALIDDSFHRDIQDLAKKECRSLPPDLDIITIKKIEETSDAAVTAPSHAFEAILKQNGIKISHDVICTIALASLYGWIAYDIYDDFLDEEGRPLLLPAANYFLRKLTRKYKGLAAQFPMTSLATLFDTALSTIDAANVWEIAHCRISASDNFGLPKMLPNYGDYDTLANRSIGYAIAPLAALIITGYSSKSPEYRATESLFRHYLIARQLHDDAHDWETDLMRGNINSIGAMLIDSYRIRFPENARAPVAEIIRPMREFFWKETIDHAVEIIYTHIKEARAARDACKFLHETGFMEDALAKLERGATKALTERNRALEFIASF